MRAGLRLQNPIVLANRCNICTVGEALDFYFALPMEKRIEPRWTEAAKLLVLTYDGSGDALLKQAERQFRRALEVSDI
jgi:hypothetical protein